jgi:mRNA-degrading endonuclease toxin of MazEF toxin-antitoxin module
MKDFDQWNEIKKSIDGLKLDQDFLCHEKEIWWCSLGVNIGIEADGKNDSRERPVLILRVFNKEMVWVLPVTSSEKKLPFYYGFDFKNQKQCVALTQIKTISTKRLRRKIGLITEDDFLKIAGLVGAFLPRFKH